MPYQYNAILGQATLNTFSVIAHHNYLCMKITVPKGIITVRGDEDLARQTERETITPTCHIHTIEADKNTGADNPSAKWAPKRSLLEKDGGPRGRALAGGARGHS